MKHLKTPYFRKHFLYFLSLLGGMFFILVIWVFFAKLDAASFAGGKIIVPGKTYTIQHLEGGIIQSIHVKEGELVKKGDVLVTLSPIQNESELLRLQNHHNDLQATSIRLRAELDSFKDPNFLGLPEQSVAAQKALFESRKNSYRTKVDLLQKNIASARIELKGLNQKQATLGRKKLLLNQTIAAKEKLVAEKIVTANALNELRLQYNDLEKEYAATLTEIGIAGQKINEAELNLVDFKNQYIEKASDELKTTSVQKGDIEKQMIGVKDILMRREIRSPVDGVVVNLRYHSLQGVVPPATEIMAVVPQTQEKMIEARVNVNDIDNVHTGLKANIVLPSYKKRKLPNIQGIVTYIASDSSMDETTKQPYYQAYVSFTEESLKALPKDINLTAGMPAEVLIVSGERTPFDYMIDPIRSSFRNSFIEE